MKGYLITQEQLEKIEHYRRMFDFNAELIKELCSGEKADVMYGFELGKMHSHLRQCFIDLMKLEHEIQHQPFDTKAK